MILHGQACRVAALVRRADRRCPSRLVAVVEIHLQDLPPEHLEKNRAAVEVLKGDVPGPAQVRDGSRSRDLTTLGFALDVLGRRAARDGDLGEALRLFQAAHELFRRASPLMHATRPMRQALGNAVRASSTDQVAPVPAGRRRRARRPGRPGGFVSSAWGAMPTQVALAIDEMILLELERARLARKATPRRATAWSGRTSRPSSSSRCRPGSSASVGTGRTSASGSPPPRYGARSAPRGAPSRCRPW